MQHSASSFIRHSSVYTYSMHYILFAGNGLLVWLASNYPADMSDGIVQRRRKNANDEVSFALVTHDFQFLLVCRKYFLLHRN